MEMIVEIEVKNVYGNLVIYPANEAAEKFAKIAGKKSLSHSDLIAIESLGFEIVEVVSPLPASWNKCAGRKVRLDGSLA